MLRWGIVGCGKIAHHFVKDLQLLEGHKLQGVASRSYDKARAFAGKYEAAIAYDDYHSLFVDADIDVVYIATPHNSHMEWSIAAMNHKKHVLCEKPLAVNRVQVEKMIAASKANDVFLMEALWSRFNPTIKEIKQRCERGDIGTLKYLSAEFCFYRNEQEGGRLFDPLLAGGALLDVGIYPVFLSYLLLGQPLNISISSQKGQSGVDLQTTMLFEYDQSTASLVCGHNCDLANNAVIAGSKGRFLIPDRWHEAQGYKETIETVVKHNTLPTVGKGYSYEIIEVGRCISKGLIESPFWTNDDSLELCGILDKIRSLIGLKFPFEQV